MTLTSLYIGKVFKIEENWFSSNFKFLGVQLMKKKIHIKKVFLIICPEVQLLQLKVGKIIWDINQYLLPLFHHPKNTSIFLIKNVSRIWLKVVISAHYVPASICFIWLVKVDFKKNVSLICILFFSVLQTKYNYMFLRFYQI